MFKKMPTHWSYTIDVITSRRWYYTMVSEFQYQAPDDVLRMLDEILSFYEINKVNNMKLVILFLISYITNFIK